MEKNVFFRALSESPKPPPITPIRATWSFFFGRQKRRFSAYYRIKFKLILIMKMMISVMKMVIILMNMEMKMTKKQTNSIVF